MKYRLPTKMYVITTVVVLIASIVCYIFGLIEPLMTTKYQILNIRLKSQDVTLFDSVRMFWQSEEYLISAIILIFTFVLPVSKYIELAARLITGKKFPTWQGIDKWNMIDVFLVAMLLLNFKMNSNIIVMSLGAGTKFIAAAVLTRLLAILLIDKSHITKCPDENIG